MCFVSSQSLSTSNMAFLVLVQWVAEYLILRKTYPGNIPFIQAMSAFATYKMMVLAAWAAFDLTRPSAILLAVLLALLLANLVRILERPISYSMDLFWTKFAGAQHHDLVAIENFRFWMAQGVMIWTGMRFCTIPSPWEHQLAPGNAPVLRWTTWKEWRVRLHLVLL